MVGPAEGEWKVLRETDGERFMSRKEVRILRENLQSSQIRNFTPSAFHSVD